MQQRTLRVAMAVSSVGACAVAVALQCIAHDRATAAAALSAAIQERNATAAILRDATQARDRQNRPLQNNAPIGPGDFPPWPTSPTQPQEPSRPVRTR